MLTINRSRIPVKNIETTYCHLFKKKIENNIYFFKEKAKTYLIETKEDSKGLPAADLPVPTFQDLPVPTVQDQSARETPNLGTGGEKK